MLKFESLDFKIIKIHSILQNIRESSIISEQKSCHSFHWTLGSLHSKQVFQVPFSMMSPRLGLFPGRMELSSLERRVCGDSGWGCSNERQTYQVGGADPRVETYGGSPKGKSLGWGGLFSDFVKMTVSCLFLVSLGGRSLVFFWFIFMCEMLCEGLNLDPNGQRVYTLSRKHCWLVLHGYQ